MKKTSAVVGVAKCPQTGKLYGVRIDTNNNRWVANWAFPINPEVAKREHYAENQFPPDLSYSTQYPGCPYCHKHEDLIQLTKPKTTIRSTKIAVTSSGCDDIGSILSSMNIKYAKYSSTGFDCDILFLNCLTSDSISYMELRKFVERGGCLYASCYADTIMKSAFPGMFDTDHSGVPHSEMVSVEDLELREIIGDKIQIEFDTSWAKLFKAKNSTCILRSTMDRKLPIMVSLRYGKGIIFFTCFHNHVQASEKEKALLQLLVIKQIGTNENISIDEAGMLLGVDMKKLKAMFKSNW